jgi:autotransporter-associated beta strand protein
VTLNGGTLTATVGSGSGYGSWNLNGTVASTGASLISSTASVPIALSAVSVDGNTTTFDVQSGTLTVSAALGQVTASGDERTSGLTKTGDGTLALTAANIYTGNTTVSAGTLSLANDAQLKFVIGANGVNNKITGTGTLDLAGDFNFDLTAAVVALGNTWKIVDNAALAETYQSSFSVIGFTGGEGAGVLWTKPIIDSLMKWEFRESTGELRTFVPGDTNEDGIADAADYIAVKTNFGMPSGATKLQGDLDGDLDVDWDDLQELMNAMATRSVGGAPPAPEPATLGLLVIGALALLRRRRK